MPPDLTVFTGVKQETSSVNTDQDNKAQWVHFCVHFPPGPGGEQPPNSA